MLTSKSFNYLEYLYIRTSGGFRGSTNSRRREHLQKVVIKLPLAFLNCFCPVVLHTLWIQHCILLAFHTKTFSTFCTCVPVGRLFYARECQLNLRLICLAQLLRKVDVLVKYFMQCIYYNSGPRTFTTPVRFQPSMSLM